MGGDEKNAVEQGVVVQQDVVNNQMVLPESDQEPAGQKMRGILNNKKKMWLLISTVVVVIIALAVGIGIYNTPTNRLRRQLDLGNRYLEEKRYAEAALAFDRAIAIDETCIEAYLGKAKACEGLEDYDTVVSLLEICHTLTDDSSYLERIQTIKNST